jgi:thiamine phosphate synthase YjbQ (UPF0047 family)
MIRFLEVRTKHRTELTLIIHRGEILLGARQGICRVEWDGPRTRRAAVGIGP